MSTYKENIFSYLNISRKEEYLTDFTINNNNDIYKVNILICVRNQLKNQTKKLVLILKIYFVRNISCYIK